MRTTTTLLGVATLAVLLPGAGAAVLPARPAYAGSAAATGPQYDGTGPGERSVSAATEYASPGLTLAADPPLVATGRSTTLTGRLTDPATGSPIPGASVRLEAAGSDGSWVELASMTSDADGRVASVQTPASTTGYRLHASDQGADAVSPLVQVPVRTLTALFDRPAVRVGRAVAIRGVLAADPGSTVRLQQRRDGRWRAAGHTATSADGSYAFTVRPTEPGFSRWRVVRDAGPTWSRAVARLPRLDAYRLHTYTVTTRGDVRSGVQTFRRVVAATYDDPRGWLRAHHRFREARPGHRGDFTVVLAQARMLPAFSSTCSSTYSCRVGRYVVINKTRWRHGSPHFPGDLETYRRMLVNHETGHWLGLGHNYCPRSGARAPVMQQQSKGMQGCRVNSWPLPREVRAVS